MATRIRPDAILSRGGSSRVDDSRSRTMATCPGSGRVPPPPSPSGYWRVSLAWTSGIVIDIEAVVGIDAVGNPSPHLLPGPERSLGRRCSHRYSGSADGLTRCKGAKRTVWG